MARVTFSGGPVRASRRKFSEGSRLFWDLILPKSEKTATLLHFKSKCGKCLRQPAAASRSRVSGIKASEPAAGEPAVGTCHISI